ncbi:MAG: hypothetical protein M1834_004308 [Cirrosporium novae-zelandiae]|nr:MAG: hypothetical protein M1834_004308 [Cirrosporium novae-zelandiae]
MASFEKVEQPQVVYNDEPKYLVEHVSGLPEVANDDDKYVTGHGVSTGKEVLAPDYHENLKHKRIYEMRRKVFCWLVVIAMVFIGGAIGGGIGGAWATKKSNSTPEMEVANKTLNATPTSTFSSAATMIIK